MGGRGGENGKWISWFGPNMWGGVLGYSSLISEFEVDGFGPTLRGVRLCDPNILQWLHQWRILVLRILNQV